MKALVPDLAMVPKLFTRSALVMPIPESSIVRVLLAYLRSELLKRREGVAGEVVHYIEAKHEY